MEFILCLIKHFSLSIKELNDSGIINFFGLLFSTIVPILIMIITIKLEKKAAKQDAAEREKQFEKTMEITNQHHMEELDTQKEINRIAIMPYLTVENKSAEIEKASSRIKFLITFKNIGNGTAINLTTKYLEPNIKLCPVFKTHLATYCCSCPFDSNTAVARPNEICQLEITQHPDGAMKPHEDVFMFTVSYTDMKQQSYNQTFKIFFDANDLTNIIITRVIVNNPELK